MALTPRLEIRQGQSLTLTPQLMQSIKLLQYSSTELALFVDNELLSNPILERGEAGDDTASTDASDRVAEHSPDADESAQATDTPEDWYGTETLTSAVAIAQTMDTEVENLYPEQTGSDSMAASASNYPDTGGFSDFGEKRDLDSYVSSGETLAEKLIAQMVLAIDEPGDRVIARHLIDSLDETGYLRGDLDQIAEQLGTDMDRIEQVLSVIQTFEPAGISARTLEECLELQLKERNRFDPIIKILLDNLGLVATHELGALKTLCGCSMEDIGDMLAEIRLLDPKPGLSFDTTPMQAIIPDVFVREANDGTWVVELNSDVLPRVLVNRTYYNKVSRLSKKGKERQFLSDCLQSANWLTKSLDQRAQTIMRVTSEIVRQQDGFLVHGVDHLRPMTLKSVADAIEMHESTVSRVTSNKYMATPRGVLELKYFFTNALASSTGGAQHSAESVRHRIKQLIDGEPTSKIYSDDAIADILRDEQEIDIARRTVAKYREAMHIPSSVIRRRQKRAATV